MKTNPNVKSRSREEHGYAIFVCNSKTTGSAGGYDLFPAGQIRVVLTQNYRPFIYSSMVMTEPLRRASSAAKVTR